jgi:hypothetical protein
MELYLYSPLCFDDVNADNIFMYDDTGEGGWSVRRRTCHSATLSTTHLIWAGLELNPVLSGNRPAAVGLLFCWRWHSGQVGWSVVFWREREREWLRQPERLRLCSICDVACIEFGTKREDVDFEDTLKSAGGKCTPNCILRAYRL